MSSRRAEIQTNDSAKLQMQLSARQIEAHEGGAPPPRPKPPPPPGRDPPNSGWKAPGAPPCTEERFCSGQVSARRMIDCMVSKPVVGRVQVWKRATDEIRCHLTMNLLTASDFAGG